MNTCAISITVADIAGSPINGAIGVLKAANLPFKATGGDYVSVGTQTTTSNSNGVITFTPVPQGMQVIVSVPIVKFKRQFVVPLTNTCSL